MKTTDQQSLLISAYSTTLAIITVITIILLTSDLTLNTFLSILIKKTYVPHKNICFAPNFNNFSFNAYIYFIIPLSFLFLVLFRSIHKKKNRNTKPINLFYSLKVNTAIIFTFALLVQGASITLYFLKMYEAFGNTTSAQIYTSSEFLSKPYLFSRKCKSVLPRNISAQLLTDMNLSKDPGMLTHRALAYYLYPIDIRGIRNKTPTALLLFNKKDAIDSIPKEFKILSHIDNSNIITIKK